MPLTDRVNSEIKTRALKALEKSTDPIEKLRNQCMSRGGTGIVGLGR